MLKLLKNIFQLFKPVQNGLSTVIQSIENKPENTMQPDLNRTAFELILAEEGFREKPYYCTEGFPTIGIGFRIGNKGDPLPADRTMTLDEARRLCYQKIDSAINQIELDHPTVWGNCNLERKVILISMYFQLGRTGLGNFKRMLAAMASSDWLQASIEAKDSRWYRQTPRRAYRHAQTLLEGKFDVYQSQGYKTVKVYYK